MISILSIINHLIEWIVSLVNLIETHSNFVIAAATAAIAAFTWALVCANRKLWQASQEHSKHLQETIAISREAADAAKKSAEIAENTLHITQMAYVDITDQQLSRPLEVGINPRILYEITNYGNTVAHITEIINVVDIVSEFPIDPDYTKCKVMSKNLPIRRNGIINKFATMDRPIDTDQINSIYNGTKFLGLWGTITYYDIFQKSFTIGYGVKYSPRANLFVLIDGYNYIKEHEEKEQS
jgi:hypothetical protein